MQTLFNTQKMRKIFHLIVFLIIQTSIFGQKVQFELQNLENKENLTIIGEYKTFKKKITASTINNVIVIDTTGMQTIYFSHIGFEPITLEQSNIKEKNTLFFKRKVVVEQSVTVKYGKIEKEKAKRQNTIIYKLANFKNYFSLDFNGKNVTKISEIEIDIKLNSLKPTDTFFVSFFNNEESIFNKKTLKDTIYTFTKLTKKTKIAVTDITDDTFETTSRIFVAVWQGQNRNSEIAPVLTLKNNVSQIYHQLIGKEEIGKVPMDEYKKYFNKYPNLNFKATFNEN